jgi:hypothetical protein
MKKYLILFAICAAASHVYAQKTLMVEKIGTSRKYFYHTGDYLKLRVSAKDTLLKGKLWSIGDTLIAVAELRPMDVRIAEIGSVYKQFRFPKKFGRYLIIGSGVFFGIITINHLINNEQVFTMDMLILSGSLMGAGLISISLGEKRCNTSKRWRVKILDMDLK